MVPGTDHATVSRIRHLFLHPQTVYTFDEAAAVLGMTAEDVRGWVEAGELEPDRTPDGWVVAWEELVSFAMGFWEQADVEEALGNELADALPELLRLRELQVRIPAMEVVALERVAARDAKTVDNVLSRELLDFVSAHADWLSADVPGFADALAWPHANRG